MKAMRLLLILLLVVPFSLSAAIIPYTQGVIKTILGGTVPTIGNSSAEMYASTSSTPSGTDISKQGVLTLGIDHHYSKVIAPYNLKVKFTITYWTSYTDSSTVISKQLEVDYQPGLESFNDRISFQIPNAVRFSAKITEIRVNNSSVNRLPENAYALGDLFVDRVVDFTPMVNTSITGIGHTLVDSDCDGKNDELLISWSPQSGAEEYQLEWTFINDYTGVSGVYENQSNLAINFKLNSTRISTTALNYKISLAFDHGYVVYRLRGVGRTPSVLDRKIFSKWSSLDEGTVQSMLNKYQVTVPWEGNKNWQFSATYAEEGKKKEVVSFFDGSLRNRQMVTKVNSDQNTIVGETIYDHQGRPVIQVLPTPVKDPSCVPTGSENSLKYYPGFTKDQSGGEFERSDFDLSLGTNSCEINSAPMNTNSGASNYYSPQNTSQANEQGYLPDAKRFPYSQVEYTPDNTGRIRRQGGVGSEFQLGTDANPKHESKYYYVHPTQEQLNRLFGSEVGDASHYQKNMVVDPNGQTSISYLDQEGRVIATSLAGSVAANMIGLDSYQSPSTVSTDLLAKDANGNSVSNALNVAGNGLEFNAVLGLSSPSPITIDYGLVIDEFTDACLENVCISCVYDLEIEIRDECGALVSKADGAPAKVSVTAGRFTINSTTQNIEFSLNTECSDYTKSESLTTATLKSGSYQITKRLTVNEDAMNYYLAAYLNEETNSCYQTFEEFQQQYASSTNFEDCTVETDCQACVTALGSLEEFVLSGKGTQQDYDAAVLDCMKPCTPVSYYETIREQLLADMKTDGQYAQAHNSSGDLDVSSFPLSILNVNNLLPINHNSPGQGTWKKPRFYQNNTLIAEYRDEDGITRTKLPVTETSLGVYSPATSLAQYDATSGSWFTYPESLINVSDFIGFYQQNPSWAVSLLPYHPEYGYLKTFKEMTELINVSDQMTSEAFDALLLETDTWQKAVNNGFIPSNWATLSVNQRLNPITIAGPGLKDPFAVHSTSVFGLPSNQITNKVGGTYVTISGVNYSMMEIAAAMVRGGSATIGYAPNGTQTNFGGPVGGSFVSAAAVATRDQEWQTFRSLYLSYKQQQQLLVAQQRAINNSAYYGYNGCIGNDEFDPFDNGFFTVSTPFMNLGQYANSLQPCSIGTDAFYLTKQQRFVNPLNQQNGSPSNVAYQAYLLTGQCPEVIGLQNLLTELALEGHLTTSGYDMNLLQSFSGLILAQNNFELTEPLPPYLWTVDNQTPTDLLVSFTENGTPMGSISLAMPSSPPAGVSWSSIEGFSNMQATGGGGFEIQAQVTVSGLTQTITLTGTSSSNLGTCSFESVCESNDFGRDLTLLMKSLTASSELFTTSGLNVQGTSPYSMLVSPSLKQAAAGSTTTSQLIWSYDAVLKQFSLYETSTSERLKLTINSASPSTFSFAALSSIATLDALVIGDNNTFKLVFNDNLGNFLVSMNCDAIYENGTLQKQMPLGECGLPTPALCDNPTVKQTEVLTAVLTDVLSNQTAPYDLMQSAAMGADLSANFPSVPTSMVGTIIGANGPGQILRFAPSNGCLVDMTIASSSTSGLGFSSVDQVTGFNLTGALSNSGNYTSFIIQAVDATGHPIVINGSTCLELNTCEGCINEVPVDSLDESVLDSIVEAQINTGVSIKDPSLEAYVSYKETIEHLNTTIGWSVGSEEYVTPIDYETFSRLGLVYSLDAYLSYIRNFDPLIDNHLYLTDAEKFLAEYGVVRSITMEYQRYLTAVDQYNAVRATSNLGSMSAVSDSTFSETIYGDSLAPYILYLRSGVAYTSNGAKSVDQYPNESYAKIDSSLCLEKYKDYVKAYSAFVANQEQNNTCLEYQVYIPLLTYESFLSQNLCCSSDGLAALDAYITVLYDPESCPGLLPYKPRCSEPIVTDTSACNKLWVTFRRMVLTYNNSLHAQLNGGSLPDLYPNYTTFMQLGKCDCLEDYLSYLRPYLSTDSTVVSTIMGVPQTLDEFCPSSPIIGEQTSCQMAYDEYLGCVALYNQWALRNNIKLIIATITLEEFINRDLCFCVDAYCAELNSIIDGFKRPERLVDLLTLCRENSTPACTPDVPFVSQATPVTVNFEDPCDDFIQSNVDANATNAYQTQVQNLTMSFINDYKAHCLGVVENLKATYQEGEYHFTLYYYDQAGNLVKTIPPAGVEFLDVYTNPSLNAQINADRQNGTHTILTQHRLATTYLYNSLNQLVAQNMPDQDAFDIFEVTQSNGLARGLTTTAIQMLNESTGYLSGYTTVANDINNTRGFLYKTTNGGKNWTRITNLLGTDLTKVVWAPNNPNVGYAIGEQGTLLYTKNQGASWDLYNTFAEGIDKEVVHLEIVSNGTGTASSNNHLILVLNDGRIYKKPYDFGNSTPSVFALTTTPPTMSISSTYGVSSFKVKDFSWNGTIASPYPIALATLTSSTTTYDALIRFNGTTWDIVTTPLSTVNALSAYPGPSEVQAIALGADGNLFSLEKAGSLLLLNKESGTTVTIDQSEFLNKNIGVVRLNNGLSSELKFTSNGGVDYSVIDGGLIDYSIAKVDRTNTNLELLAFNGLTGIYKRIVVTSTGQIMTIDQTPSTVQNTLQLQSVQGVKTGTTLRYLAVSQTGVVYQSNALTSSSQKITFSPISASLPGTGTPTKLVAYAQGGEIALAILRSGQLYTSLSSSNNFSSFTTQTNASHQFVDIAQVNSGSDAFVGYNQLDGKLYTFTTNASSLLVKTAVSVSGITQLSSCNSRVVLSGNGNLYTQDIVSGSLSSMTSYELRGFAKLNDLYRSESGAFVAVGDNGTVLTVDAFTSLTSTLTRSLVSVNTTSDLFTSTRLELSTSTVRTLFAGSNGTLIERNDLGIVSPVLLNTGQLISSTYTGTLKSLSTGVITPGTPSNGFYFYAVGENGRMLYTPNYLTTAPGLATVSGSEGLNNVALIPGTNKSVAVGESGVVYRLVGLTATRNTQVYVPRLKDVHFANNMLGTVIGDFFVVRSTTDGGNTWNSLWAANSTPVLSNTQTEVLTKVWTVIPASGQHYALLGGVNFLSSVYNDQITLGSVTGTVGDIQFHRNSPHHGYLIANTSATSGNLRELTLTSISGGLSPFTLAVGAPSNFTTGYSGKALHVFENNNALVLIQNSSSAGFTQYNGSTLLPLTVSGSLTGVYNDLYFHDDRSGYAVGNAGKWLSLSAQWVSGTTTVNTITATPRTILDPVTGASTDWNITALSFGSRYEGVYGGSYTSASFTSSSSFVRTLLDQSNLYTARFFYDRLGRIVVSQNSRQYNSSGGRKYSYTLYDELGRVKEAGEKTENNSGQLQFAQIFGAYVGGVMMPTVIDDSDLANWLSADNTKRKEVTRSYYDASNSAIASQLPTGFIVDPMTQRKRIVHVTYEEQYDANDATYDHATHYNYDIHGNVVTLLQDNKKMSVITDIASSRFKQMNYAFDLISGNVHRVSYQNGKSDQWQHAYEYDADNRITDVYTTTATPYTTSTSSVSDLQNEPILSPYWDKESAYEYYDHGPLARIELGDEKVQGLDYVYTLQGWIKGVNSNNLDPANDPGKDGFLGNSSNNNKKVARDVMGYSLSYFDGDYAAIVSTNSNMLLTRNSSSKIDIQKKNLYNGNIGMMVTTITHPDTREVRPLGTVYNYDQLNRLKHARSYNNIDLAGNTWLSGGTLRYENTFDYDANGNILKQVRRDENNGIIDSLIYKYHLNSGNKLVRNRLYHVQDLQSTTSATDDIEDMGLFTSGSNINVSNNYVFDAEGRLIKDVQEQIASIEWRVDGKVKRINRTGGPTKKSLSFDYDAMGHRIAKHVYSNSTGILEKSTYYVLDAQGNVMSVYEREVNNSSQTTKFTQTEKYMYGSSRLGVLNCKIDLLGTAGTTAYSQTTWLHTIGQRTYELSNHLGNVLSVISDKVLPYSSNGTTVDYYLADVRQSSDYSPFGVQLSGRNFVKSGAKEGRFGFNGMEETDEWSGDGNSYDFGARMLDTRLGRFSTVDPLANSYPNISPYAFVANMPIIAIDPTGEFIIFPNNESIEAGKGWLKQLGLEKEFRINKKGILKKIWTPFHKNDELTKAMKGNWGSRSVTEVSVSYGDCWSVGYQEKEGDVFFKNGIGTTIVSTNIIAGFFGQNDGKLTIIVVCDNDVETTCENDKGEIENYCINSTAASFIGSLCGKDAENDARQRLGLDPLSDEEYSRKENNNLFDRSASPEVLPVVNSRDEFGNCSEMNFLYENNFPDYTHFRVRFNSSNDGPMEEEKMNRSPYMILGKYKEY